MAKHWSPSKFTMDLKRDSANIQATVRGAFRKKLSTFLKDLSSGIIAHSPVNPPSEYALNNYISNTYIVQGSSQRNYDVDMDEQRSYKSYRPSAIANLFSIVKKIQSDQPIPKILTIINQSSKGDFQYSQLVQKYGWKHVEAYKPFYKGLQYALSKHPDMGNIVYSVQSTDA